MANGVKRWRTVLGLVVTALVWLISVPTTAQAWANGTDGCNSFGTHDWILNKAIKAVGKDGSWIRAGVALRATDDPDCRDGIDHASGTWWHVYDRWGDEWGGADEATRVWFRRTKHRLEDGKERSASRALGIMSHFVADVANPMHTDSSEKEESIHSPYESDVDKRVADYPFSYDGEDAVKPAATIRKVARKAHRIYKDLVRAYDRHGYNDKVHGMTKRQLKRGVNAIADLITQLSSR